MELKGSCGLVSGWFAGCLSGPGRSAGQGASANCGNFHHSVLQEPSYHSTAFFYPAVQHSVGLCSKAMDGAPYTQCPISPYIVSLIVDRPTVAPCSSSVLSGQGGEGSVLALGTSSHCSKTMAAAAPPPGGQN